MFEIVVLIIDEDRGVKMLTVLLQSMKFINRGFLFSEHRPRMVNGVCLDDSQKPCKPSSMSLQASGKLAKEEDSKTGMVGMRGC